MRLTVFVGLLLVPAAALAGFTATGVGGGGWLHSGAILPTDPDVIVVGSDVAGVYRTDDFGASWTPWNDGLPDVNGMDVHHVEDLLGVDYDGWTGFYAATGGGIYRREEGSDWVCMTEPEDYCYTDNASGRTASIPFSCLDWDGADQIVAGAGHLWMYAYPGLDPGDFTKCGDYDSMWTVWKKDLNYLMTTFEPVPGSTFGTARDISIAAIENVTYIAVATSDSIMLAVDGKWTCVWDSTSTRDSLTCWSVHLTDRGTLYAAMGHAEDASGPYASGVYRIFDITDEECSWAWGGDGEDVPPHDVSLHEIGSSHWYNLTKLSVVDGKKEADDLLWLGSLNHYGLFRGYQPYHADSMCHWKNKLYNYTDPRTYHYLSVEDTEKDLPVGWSQGQNLAFIAHPIVSEFYPESLAVHTDGGRLFVSAERGDEWTQAYTTETYEGSGFWYSTGYSELAVYDIEVLPDGRVVESTGDHGFFRSSDGDMTDWEHLDVPPSAPTNQGGEMDTWGDTLFVICGDTGQGMTYTKLYMVDENDTWHDMSADLGAESNHRFNDVVAVDDDVVFVAYVKFEGQVGTTNVVEETGVYKVVPDGWGGWLWQKRNNGLEAISTPISVNAYGVALLLHEGGRIFLAARQINLLLPNQQDRTPVPGGIYKLDSKTDTSWELEIGGDGSEWQDCRSLAQSLEGEVVYAGTRGCPTSITGTVFKCINPESDPTTWTPLVNKGSNPYPFGFVAPFYKGWSDTNANKYLTDVRSLAVDTRDTNLVYVGLHRNPSFYEPQGLWRYDPSKFLNKWKHLSDGEVFTGVGVSALLTYPDGDDCMLVVGTHGEELYYSLRVSGGGQLGGAPRSGLNLVAVSSQLGGRTEVRFSLAEPAPVEMKVYDVMGRVVHHHNAGRQKAGQVSLIWDGRTSSGKACAPGVYFMHLTAGHDKAHRKFLLIR